MLPKDLQGWSGNGGELGVPRSLRWKKHGRGTVRKAAGSRACPSQGELAKPFASADAPGSQLRSGLLTWNLLAPVCLN